MSYLKQRPGSIEEVITKLSSKVLESDYQDKFKKELDKAGKGVGSMTPAEKKAFFNKIDKMHTAKDEQASKGDIDKFHKKLDNLVHKSFGHSSDEKKMKKEQVEEQQTIRIIPGRGDKESKQAFDYYSKTTGGKVGSYGVTGSTNFITLSVPTQRVAAATKAMANKKFGQYSVKVVGSNYMDKFEEKEINEDNNPFELYQSKAGWQQASAEMKKEMEKAKKMPNKQKAREHMYAVQKKYAKYGAQDTEANVEIRHQLGMNEETIVEFTTQQIKMAYGVANDKRYKAGNYSGAVAAIEKIAKGLSKHPDVAKVLKRVNEDQELDETHMGQTQKANQSQKDAKGEKEVVKPIKETILDIWKEAAEKKDEKKKDATPPVDNSDEQPKKEEESADKAKAETEKAKDQVQLLKQKVEQEKNKQVQQRVNPETGEPLLQVGVAYKHLKDKMKQEGATAKKEEEEQNKNKKTTDTGEKPSEIEKNPEIKYAN